MEFDDMPEPFEDDLEEFERKQIAADREGFVFEDEMEPGEAEEGYDPLAD